MSSSFYHLLVEVGRSFFPFPGGWVQESFSGLTAGTGERFRTAGLAVGVLTAGAAACSRTAGGAFFSRTAGLAARFVTAGAGAFSRMAGLSAGSFRAGRLSAFFRRGGNFRVQRYTTALMGGNVSTRDWPRPWQGTYSLFTGALSPRPCPPYASSSVLKMQVYCPAAGTPMR